MPCATEEDKFKPLYKRHRRLARSDLPSDVLDSSQPGNYTGPYTLQTCQPGESELDRISRIIDQYTTSCPPLTNDSTNCITVDELPGLKIISNLFSEHAEKRLVRDTIETYVPDSRHVSNLTPFYNLPDPLNLFPASHHHQSITHKEGKSSTDIESIRNKQLRWITLGGQYDWTAKVYPSFERDSQWFPDFPPELVSLLGGIFDMTPEAAIINFYSPGDILSPHQDVAELSRADLISVSVGCECIFYCGPSRNTEPLQLLLKSGDVVVMGGESRQAFHGVGRVFEETCPEYLLNETSGWKREYCDWIKTKRVNVNVRQMLKS